MDMEMKWKVVELTKITVIFGLIFGTIFSKQVFAGPQDPLKSTVIMEPDAGFKAEKKIDVTKSLPQGPITEEVTEAQKIETLSNAFAALEADENGDRNGIVDIFKISR